MKQLLSFQKVQKPLIFFIIFFPYVTFGIFLSDTSPFYLLLIAFLIFLRSSYSRLGLLKAALFVIILLLIDFAISTEINILKFCATVIIAESCFHYGRLLTYSISYKLILFLSVVWLFSGLITLIQPDFFSFLFYRVGYTSEISGAIRGAPGLTPEPSYYGMASAFLYAFAMQTKINRTGNKSLDLPSLIFGISVLLSLSLYGLAVLGVLAFKYNRYLSILSLISGLLVLTYIDTTFARLTLVLAEAIASGGSSLLEDSSIMYRLSNFILIYEIITTDSSGTSALTSGITVLFANYGLLAFLLIFLMFLLSSWNNTVLRLSSDIFFLPLVIVMFFIGPLSNPYFWIYLGSSYSDYR